VLFLYKPFQPPVDLALLFNELDQLANDFIIAFHFSVLPIIFLIGAISRASFFSSVLFSTMISARTLETGTSRTLA